MQTQVMINAKGQNILLCLIYCRQNILGPLTRDIYHSRQFKIEKLDILSELTGGEDTHLYNQINR